MKEIGKEIGLIHEMLITGRKANVGEPFYTTLAQNEDWFKTISLLTLQFGAMKKLETIGVVDIEKAKPLIENVRLILESGGQPFCIACDWSTRRNLAHLYVPSDILEKDMKKVQELETTDKRRDEICAEMYRCYSGYFFNNIIGKGLMEIGIHPEELVLYYNGIVIKNNSFIDSCCCGDWLKFAKGLQQTIIQHNIICQMIAK